MEDSKHRLRRVIAGCFPPGARVIAVPRQVGLVFAISWPLGTDPARPLKRSKIIRLAIEEPVIEAYDLASRRLRQRADVQLARALRERLSAFDPDHQQAPHQAAVIVTWTIGSAD